MRPTAGIGIAALRRRAVLVVALAFVAVGVLGFVPGATTDLDELEFAGHESGAELFGIFQVSVLHNLTHLALGAAGLVVYLVGRWTTAFFLVEGSLYLALWVYGRVVDPHSEANVVPLDAADNWLHLGLGGALLWFGLVTWEQEAGAGNGPGTAAEAGQAPPPVLADEPDEGARPGIGDHRGRAR